MKQAAPAAKVILSAHDDESDVLEALNEAGVAGYLVKSDAPEELISAVRSVAVGKRYLQLGDRPDHPGPAQKAALTRCKQSKPSHLTRARSAAAAQ